MEPVVAESIVEEKKAVSFKIVESKLLIEVDPNKNGVPVLKLELDLIEVPSEVVSVIKK